MAAYILALDQGTTSSRAILFDAEGIVCGQASQEIQQIYPQPGWVEHDPMQIWQSVHHAAQQVIHKARVSLSDIRAVGITNQRETTILWDRLTGQPVHNAIVWQCRRSVPFCEQLRQRGLEGEVRARSGLTLDAYFSGTKLQWFFAHIPDLGRRASRGELCFGTVDSWLISRLTGGRLHLTDPSNASRTMLYNIHCRTWDPTLLEALGIPCEILPELRPSSQVYGETDPAAFLGVALPIASVAGDQQAALFGQACFVPGMAKHTYGTGGFLLLQTGTIPISSTAGLLTTVAWEREGQMEYALEGSVFMAGAVIQWLRDELRLIPSAAASETIAAEVPDTNGVYFVPAFVGLGAPYWDPYARGTIVGLTRGATRGHLVRAALEAIAYQTRDVFEAMQQDAGLAVPELRVDGGAAANNLLMQFQADILGVPIVRTIGTETTARGAAYLAGLAVGLWKNPTVLADRWQAESCFFPRLPAERRERLYAEWKRAVERARGWAVG